MASKITNQSMKNVRRNLLRQITAGAAVSISATNLPAAWVKPVVESVVLPAHAATSTCNVLLEQIDRSIPQACSGGLFPQISIVIQAAAAEPGLIITGVTVNLPGQATMSGISVGDVFNVGDLSVIQIENYPSASQFSCQATEPGSIIIEYNCEDLAGAGQSLSIDVLQNIILG